MAQPNIGEKIPDFSLQDQDGKTHSTTPNLGAWTLIYFYPKDDTPGCTKEAIGFKENFETLEKEGLRVWGISPDNSASHKKFADKFSLPFTLLADTDAKVADAFGVWGEKNMYGRKYMGVFRHSFLVGPDNVLKKHYAKVKPETHATEVLEDYRSIK